MNPIKKVNAVFLLLLSMLFVFPKDCLHEFACHEDTHDQLFPDKGIVNIGNAHHHCTSLQLFFEVFDQAEESCNFVVHCFPVSSIPEDFVQFYHQPFFYTENRGPPSVS